MSEPKRHHYVPRFYLKGFAEHGSLWVYDLEKQEIRQQKPGSIAVKKHFYSVTNGDGERDNSVELALSQAEGAAAPAVAALARGEPLSEEQRGDLAFFAALMKSRTLEFDAKYTELADGAIKAMNRRRFASVEAARQAIARTERGTGQTLHTTPEKMVEFAARGEYEVMTPREQAIGAFLRSALDAYPYFFLMDWTVVLAAENAQFLTSDDPFTLIPPPDWRREDGGIGFLTRGVVKQLPLTSNACLMMGDKGGGLEFRKASPIEVNSINTTIARGAGRLVIGGDKQLVKDAVTASGARVRPKGTRWRFSD